MKILPEKFFNKRERARGNTIYLIEILFSFITEDFSSPLKFPDLISSHYIVFAKNWTIWKLGRVIVYGIAHGLSGIVARQFLKPLCSEGEKYSLLFYLKRKPLCSALFAVKRTK